MLWDAVIVKSPPAVFAVTARAEGVVTVPKDWQVKNTIELAVIEVVFTVAVPATRATVPKELAPAAVLLAT